MDFLFTDLGGSSLISRLFGEKREEEAKQAGAFCIWGSIMFGICVSVVLLTFREPIKLRPWELH